MCHVPRYYYVDQEKVCVQCEQPFTFSAEEQKHWYETLRFWFDSVAIRCVSCRRRQRNLKAMHNQASAARRALRDDPDNPAHLIALAEGVVRRLELGGSGSLEPGIAAARRAQRIMPRAAEAIYWEGRCQEMADRPAKAEACYLRLLKLAAGSGKAKVWLKYAREFCQRSDSGDAQ